MRYDFTIATYIRRILPLALRKAGIIAFMEVLSRPLTTTQEAFTAYRAEARYYANLTSQTLLLESYLNDQLDPVQRRIAIQHTLSGGVFVGLRELAEEGIFVGLKEAAEEGVFVPMKGEDEQALTVDFRVSAPATVNTDQLIAYLNNYKLAGKSYEIVTT
jgi:hypothetical protein